MIIINMFLSLFAKYLLTRVLFIKSVLFDSVSKLGMRLWSYFVIMTDVLIDNNIHICIIWILL